VAGSSTGAPPNIWARLVRSGRNFYAYKSTDGAHWKLINSKAISMATNIYLGFAVGSGDTNTLNAATFSGATVIP
jgi:hypothetical protein